MLHRQNPDGYTIDTDARTLAYADSTQDASAGYGVIYVGIVAPAADSLLMQPLAEPAGDATGHILARGTYTPGTEYVYWWGSGWSKGFMADSTAWQQYLTDFSTRISSPLKATVK